MQSIAYGEKLLAEGWLSTQSVEALESLAAEIPHRMLNPQDFRRRLLIDASGSSKPLESCLDPWQREDYEAADQGWLRMVTGHGDAKLRYYFERPKGHDKTTGEAHMAGWAMHVCPRPLEAIAVASTLKQAQQIAEAMDRMVRRNPWLSDTISVYNRDVKNRRTGSLLKILTGDEATNQGSNPDFVIGDELTVWKNPKLWDMLITSAGKKTNCMVVVIANAGFGRGVSWQWKVMEYARTHPEKWHFRSLPGPVASWISKEEIESQREQVVFGTEFQRVWLNQWVEQGSETLSAADIDACTTSLAPMTGYDPQYEPFIAGLDLAYSGHHAALAVVGVHARTGKVRLASIQSWKPSDFPGRKIDLTVVHRAVVEARRKFRLHQLCVDPWQAQLSLQLLAKDVAANPSLAMRIKEIHGARDNQDMASAIVDAINNHRIELFAHKELRDDLLKLSIEEKQHHFAIKAPEDKQSGHCDRAIALAMTLPAALAIAGDLHLNPIGHESEPARQPVVGANGNAYLAPGERRFRSV